MSSPPEYSVVITCYRSGQWLGELVDRVSDVMSMMDHEIILVNDSSPDDVTWAAICNAAEENHKVRGLDLARNVGQFAALMCGLEASRGQFIITLDDDFQHPPEEIPKLIAGLTEEVDVVIGAYGQKQHGGFRNLGSRLMDQIFRSFGKPEDLKMGSFRILRRSVVDTMLAFGTVRPVPGALILQSTRHIRNVDVDHHQRSRGSSGYSVRRLVTSSIDNIVNASTAPLRLISGSGLLIAGLAAAAMIFYLLQALFADRAVPGFSTTVTLITFFGGATLLAIGVVGEYIARLVAEAARPPLFSIRERTWSGDITPPEE